ncbi:hypothetical protein ABGB16_23735 [Micromonospora sp. B11E3]|uniref:hypothetical protein n=1 Tax=Micromonospora sp. B11E3 TaxID=3153562 RepID=UPI00325D42F0
MDEVFGRGRAGERPPLLFWVASAGGLPAVLAFLGATGAVHGALSRADLFLLAAVVLCGLGYAEGGALARELGGARTICWALLLGETVTTASIAAALVVLACVVLIQRTRNSGQASEVGKA